MMITTQQMYWLTRLDGIVITLGVFIVVGVIAAIILYIVGVTACDIDDESCQKTWRIATRLLYAVSLAVVIWIFIPTTKEMAAIIVIPKIVNNEKVQDAGNKLYDLAVEWLEALKPEKNTNEAK